MSLNQALTLELTRETDRFYSTLRLVDGSHSTTVLTSVEGKGNESWPPSPVIQDLMNQDRPSGAFLAGVGMAGKSHWSVVVETQPESAAIELDYACRVKQEPEWLGSTYSILNSKASLKSGTNLKSGNCLTLKVGDVVIRCETLTAGTECRLASDAGQLCFVADSQPAQELPRTIRWKYRFSCVLAEVLAVDENS